MKSYLKECEDLYVDLVNRHQSAKRRREEIEQSAKEQQTQWEAVIRIFNERFYVPFELDVPNKMEVVLGQEKLLKLGFLFEDDTESEPIQVERNTLLQVLSTGEKKALYILNVIFEIERRKKLNHKTILIVDDIANSFDHKNKYAIIEYLRYNSENNQFYQIILTHNFDFFRTIESRFVPHKNCLMAFKSESGVNLDQAKGIRNVFTRDWKVNFYTDSRKRIASIPFIRNIVEYTKGEGDPDYLNLTALLHWKTATQNVKQKELDRIYQETFGENATSINGEQTVIELVFREASSCLSAPD